jgi:ribonuclease P protein component
MTRAPHVAAMPDESFSKRYRLLTSSEFQRVYAAKQAVSDHLLILNGVRSGLTTCRLGLAVSRKVGSAVLRNRWKRLIREAFRRLRAELPGGIDLVVRPRVGANPDYAAVVGSLPGLVRRLNKRLPPSKTPSPVPGGEP